MTRLATRQRTRRLVLGRSGCRRVAEFGVSVNADVGDHRNRPPGGDLRLPTAAT